MPKPSPPNLVRSITDIIPTNLRIFLQGKAITSSYIPIYRSLISTTPLHILSCILLCIFSQIFLLATLVLPWKLLVIISTERLPIIFPSILDSIDRDSQIKLICFMILSSLILHLSCDLLINHICTKGACSILSKQKKTGLFNNHKELAIQLYGHFSKILAFGVFFILAMGWLSLIYPTLLIPITLYVVLWVTIWSKFVASHPDRIKKIKSNIPVITKIWVHAGVIFILSWVILDYWQGTIPNIILTFISLILIRQALSMLAQLIHHAYIANRYEAKSKVLFIHNATWQPKTKIHTEFKELVAHEARDNWIIQSINKDLKVNINNIFTQCRLVSSGNIAYIKAHPKFEDGSLDPILLKVYNRPYYSVAEHELEILKVAKAHWPSSTVISNGKIQDFPYVAMKWDKKATWLNNQNRSKIIHEVRANLMACSIPLDLEDRHKRTHPSLYERLENIPWNEVIHLSGKDELIDTIQTFKENWDHLRAIIEHLPKQVVLPGLNSRLIAQDENKKLIICGWARWAWEPIGSTWPIREDMQSLIKDGLKKASHHRIELEKVLPAHVELAAYLFVFEQRARKQDYPGAASILASTINLCKVKIGIDM